MNIAICDDRKAHLEKGCEIIRRAAAQNGIPVKIDSFTSGENLLYSVHDDCSQFDIIFLDINMPQIKGTELARQLMEQEPGIPVVFFTVSKDHCLEAFDVGAFNYVLKNEAAYERIESILLRIHQKLEEENEDFIILVSCGEKVIVPIRQIRYFESQTRIMTIYYGEKSFEFYSRMKVLEEELYGKGFLRIHRSYLVAISEIKSFNMRSITLNDGTELPVGSTYAKNVASVLQSFAEGRAAI